MENYNTIRFGTLVYNDYGRFELHGNNKISNLSSLLDNVYFSRISNQANIKIMEGCKTLFHEDGLLYRKVISKSTRPDYCLFDYYILGANLSAFLFNSTGKNLEILIQAEALVA